MNEKNLEGKTIAILGLGGSLSDYLMSRLNSVQFDEVWGINSVGAVIHVTRTFMMDPAARFLDDVKAGNQTGIAQEFLLETPNKGSIYSCCLDDRVPEIVEYPLEEVVAATTFSYFNNTVAYAVAFAIKEKVGKINFYGIDFSYKHNLHFAEAGRACVEFWCAIAMSRGIRIQVSPASPLMDSNVPDEEKLYGYHRLDDPLVQTVSNGSLMISKMSDMSPPEPIDTDPFLFGREDVEGKSY